MAKKKGLILPKLTETEQDLLHWEPETLQIQVTPYSPSSELLVTLLGDNITKSRGERAYVCEVLPQRT
jgi:hypothetical protein